MGKSVELLITGLGYGGAEAQTLSLALALRDQGWQVTLTSMVSPRRNLEDLHRAGVGILDLGMGHVLKALTFLPKYIRHIRTTRPDVIHAHMFHASIVARAVGAALRVPVISTMHSDAHGGFGRKLALRATDWMGYANTHVSLSGAKEFESNRLAPFRKVLHVPNGIGFELDSPPSPSSDLRSQLGIDADFLWACVARNHPAKDLGTLLDAFSKLPRDRKPGLLLVGHGTEWLRDEIACRGLTMSVHPLGVRTDVRQILEAVDGFVLSSRWEGMPISVLEACVAGLPIACTDVGSIRYMLPEVQHLYLVQPQSPDKLANAMRRIMQLSEMELGSLGESNRQNCYDRFSLNAVCASYEELYLEAKTSFRR